MMDKINGFGLYQAYNEQNVKRNSAKENAEKTEKSEKNSETKMSDLSDKAKALLEELKSQYKDMDFIVANYSSDEEAQQYLSRGTKEYSVLIDPELLEEMANDDATKEKYLGVLDDATNQLGEIEEELGDDAENVKSIGFSINADGEVSFFAELEKMSEQQRERIEQAKEDKAEAKKEEAAEEKKAKNEKAPAGGPVKRAFVEADSIDALVEKIRGVDWDQISEVKEEVPGSRFNFSI